jgi:hypothetical protein
MNPVRLTTRKVAEQSHFIRINEERIVEFISLLSPAKPDSSKLETLSRLKTDNKNTLLTFLILMTRTGFCFWNAEETRWHYTYKDGSKNKGQFAFFQAWVDYFNTDPSRFSFEHFSVLGYKEFTEIFQGGKNLYFLKERWEFVRDISKYFLTEWEGDIEAFILSANHRLYKLLPLITSSLPSYNDKADYKGETIYFWKLAQLFIYDLVDGFKGDPVGEFLDMEYLTGLSD